MPTGLPKSVIDIFFSALNQTPGDHSDGNGRLVSMLDCQVRKYIGPGQVGERILIEQRDAFQGQSTSARNVGDGSPVTVDWATPELLGTLGNQLVDVSGSVPRVFSAAENWSAWPGNLALSGKLSEDVYHTSDHLLQAPTGASLGDTTGFVWTEAPLTDAGPVGTTYFGIKSSVGTWVLAPARLYAAPDQTVKTMAKVVSDGSHYWVFWNDAAGAFHLNIIVYNADGSQVATTQFAQAWQASPGFWDVTYQAGAVLLAEPGGSNLSENTNVHVKVSKLTLVSGSIVRASATDTAMNCEGRLGWLTNDTDNASAYLGTMGTGSSSGNLFGYQINPATQLSIKEYATLASLSAQPDSITGWTIPDSGHQDLAICYSLLAPSQSTGPKYDPAMRTTNTVYITYSSVAGGSVVRKVNSVCLVGRAFAVNGRYYAHTYYQSGSGLTITNTPITVSIDNLVDSFSGSGSRTLTVTKGDVVQGAALSLSGTSVQTSAGQGSTGMTSGDKVEQVIVAAGDPITVTGIPVGTTLLKWSLTGVTATNALGQLTISACSEPTAVGSWELCPSTGTLLTFDTNSAGNTVVPATFTSGTYSIPAVARYNIPSLAEAITPETKSLYVNAGKLTWTGDSVSGNNVANMNIVLANLGPGVEQNGFPASIIVTKTSQSYSNTASTASVTPQVPGRWDFTAETFDGSDIGSSIVVDGGNSDTPANDIGSFKITGTAGGGNLSTTGSDSSALVSHFWNNLPFPSVSVVSPVDSIAYKFILHNVTLDYTYFGAIVQVASGQHSANTGTYKITWIDPTDAGHHTFVAIPTNGKTDQVSQLFSSGLSDSITIFKSNGIVQEFQPCWFITPLMSAPESEQPQAGCFERGLAYSDWRYEGEAAPLGPNTYPLSLSSPFKVGTDTAIMLPFRAKSFTAGQAETTPSGVTTTVVSETLESTVGVKRFVLSHPGQSVEAFQELLMPGPLAGSFTSTGFHEQGFNLGPEAPFLITEAHDTSLPGVTSGAISLQVVWEATDDNGERVWSYPSPALEFTLQAPNNTYTIGGRLPMPLSSAGAYTFGEAGVLNRINLPTRQVNLNISIYRTAIINGIPTTQLYKVTNDLNPNGLSTGGAGFTFPDTISWTYKDTSLDAAIVDQESLYTSKGLLPRFQAPAFIQGDVWEDRTWLCGYDGAVWLSGDKTEGDSNWFFPGFRLSIGNDTALTVSRMEQYLVIGGRNHMWYIPAQTFPDNTGSGGNLPTPSPLPFNNGCTGFAVTTTPGTVYSSTAGGAWLVTRDLKNVWLSEPLKDVLNNITGMAVDGKQRVGIVDGTNNLFVFDPIPQVWYQWRLPTAAVKLWSWQGNFVYQDTTQVFVQVPGAYLDTAQGGHSAINIDFKLAPLLVAQARSVKHVWAMQLVGQYKGPHKLNAVISYPDDGQESPTTFGPYTPDSSEPYIIEINPGVEEASRYDLRVFTSFEGIGTPGQTAQFELVSAEVAIDKKQGVFKPGTAQRIPGN